MLARLLNVFHVGTLMSLGCGTYATINNSTAETIGECSIKVSASIYNQRGVLVQYIREIAFIPPGKSFRFDCDKLVHMHCDTESVSGEYLITFHMLPSLLSTESSYDATVDEDKGTVLKLALAKDNFVEYVYRDAVAAGVLYQCLPFNYNPYFSPGSSLIQAPKILSGGFYNTKLLFMYSCPDNPVDPDPAIYKLRLRNLGGKVIKEWSEEQTANTVNIVPVSNYMTTSSKLSSVKPEIATLEGFSPDKHLVILSVIHTETSLAVEHSLPPSYYIKGAQPELRKWMLSQQ